MVWYIARHGETDFNRRRLMQGQRVDAPLNARGELQARALANRLASVPLEAVFSSPLQRALETARIVADAHEDQSIEVLDDLTEMSWGDLEGRPIDDVADELRAMAAVWRAGSFDGRLGGGESIRDVEVRARRVLDRLRETHGDRTILILTHGRFLRVLLATAITGADLTQMDRFGHANTGVYRLRLDEGRWVADLHNCTAHLDELAFDHDSVSA